MANISQGSTENVVLGEGYSPWALNSNDLYPDSTSYIVGIGTTDPDYTLHVEGSTTGVKIDANTDHLKFLDKDGGVNDNGILFQYTETTTNAAKLKLFMDVADFNENYIELLMGSSLGASFCHQEGTNLDAKIINTGSVFKIGTGTSHPVEFHTGNNSKMVLGTAGELEITNTSANQLKLSDGTNYATWQTAGDDLILNVDGGALDNLTIEADTGKFIFQSNAGSNNTVTLNADNGWNYIPSIANTTLNTKIIKSGAAISAPTGIFFDWGRKEANTSKTADYTAGEGDHVVFCDPTSGSMTITLPEATGGRVMRIKNTTTGLANTVTVATPASETIDGQASSVLSASYGTIELVADGTNWFILNVV